MRRTTCAWLALGGLAVLVTGCGGDDDDAATAVPELVIWADNSANTATAIEPLCAQWAEENGVRCRVVKFNGGGDINTQLTRGNDTGDVPDLFEGPHDQIGDLVRNGIIAPVDLGSKVDQFLPAAVAGVTFDGGVFGVPWAVENIALLTNTDLSPECPATLDEAVATAEALIADGTTPKGLGIAMQIGSTGDAYHWYPLYTADGGYAFGQNPDGTYNVEDLGVGTPGSIAAGERLQQLIDDGVLGGTVSYDIARESFGKGQSPFFITGPWQIPEQSEALGDALKVCPIPNWEGSEYVSQPFLGVRTFMQPAKAHNPVLAQSFLFDYAMTTEFMDAMFSVDPRPPAWLESYEKAAEDPVIKGFGDYGAQGVPMPAVPQMGAIFSDLGLAEYQITTGENATTVMERADVSITKQNDELG